LDDESRRGEKTMAQKLEIGMPVRCATGEVGSLSRIVVDREIQQPSYLVVQGGNKPSQREVVVPINLISAVHRQGILLDTTLEALETFPDYEVKVKRQIPTPESTWPNPPQPLFLSPWVEEGVITLRRRTVPEHTVDVWHGMSVYDCAGAKLGRAEGILVDAEKQQASHLVLRRRSPRQYEPVLVPVDLVEFVIKGQVYLRIDNDHVHELTVYRSKEVLEGN
jgi:sporulation protein YlmC with PRC-barrel domain